MDFRIKKINDYSKLVVKNIPLNRFFKSEFMIYIFLCLISVSLYGQSLSQLELNFQNLKYSLKMEQAKLDSLNTVHNNMISDIYNEKKNEYADEDKISEMLASAVVVSNQIRKEQIELGKIESKFEDLKKNLDIQYTTKIDSINILKNSTTNLSEEELLKSEKIKYIEKRMIVAAKIYSLSFDPQKLIQYKPSALNDTLEKKIYGEYLGNALEEVEKQSQQLALLKNEIEEVVNLQTESSDFIEDVDSEMMFNPALQSSQLSARNEGVYLGGDPNRLDNQISNIYSQANSYLNILNQLKTSTTINAPSQWQTPTDTIPANLTFQQYLNLLEDVDKMLKDYRTILEHKLESN